MGGITKPPVKIINTKDNKINKPDSQIKPAAYFKTYTLQDIGDIDPMADSSIIHIDTDSNGDIVQNNSIKFREIKKFKPIVEKFGYSTSNSATMDEIMRLAALTDDSIKSVGEPLNFTDEDVSNPLFKKYFIYSMCVPPLTITHAQVKLAIKDNEDAFKYLQAKYRDKIKETHGIENCMPHKPIVVEAYIDGITNAGKYNTIFVSKNGKLYHLNFLKSHVPSWVNDLRIAILHETGNESLTNPDFFTYGEVHRAFSGTDILNGFIVSLEQFFHINTKINIPSELVGLNDIDIPNHSMFGSISSSSGLNNMVDLVETELLFLSSENISEIDIADKIMTSGTNIPSGSFEVMNAQNSIICTHRFLGCTTDDSYRTNSKIFNFHEKFRGAPTQYAVEQCGHLAASNEDNMFALQYDNECRGSKLTGLPALESVLKQSKGQYEKVDTRTLANSSDEANQLAVTRDKTCIQNIGDGRGATIGSGWTNAIYEIANKNCYTYVSVSLRLDEKYGLYLERRTLSNKDSDSYNSSDDTIDRVHIWDIRKYDINPMDDLADNPDWHSRDVRFPDGEIKHNEFISIGQIMYNRESRKTMKLYIDKLGHIRILLSINPSSRNAEKILKMMREQYFGRGQYPIISSLNYGDDGKKINGSIYNPAYYNGFIKLHKTTTNATLGVEDRDIVLRLNIDNQLSSLNPFNPKKTIYYKLKSEELETDCRNFIHDEMAMMPPILSLPITDKENTSLTALEPSTTISDKRDKTDIRDACLDKCRDTSDCDFAVIQGQSCNRYRREAIQYLINKNDSIATLTDNHDVYRKVCMPNTNTSSGSSMAKAGFLNDIGGPMNAVLGENFMILNDPTMVNQFRKEVSENSVELSGKETIEYNEVDKIAAIINGHINLENIPEYENNDKATIERFITQYGWPTIPLADINSPDNTIITYYTNIQSKLLANKSIETTTDILKKIDSIQLENNSQATVISKSGTSGFANMNISEYTEVADREKIDSDTRHLDGLLREIRNSINCPYSQPIQNSDSDSDSWTDNIFTPEYIALIIIAISLIYILYKIHSRR